MDFSRGLIFADEHEFKYFAWTNFRGKFENPRKPRKLIHAIITPCKSFHLIMVPPRRMQFYKKFINVRVLFFPTQTLLLLLTKMSKNSIRSNVIKRALKTYLIPPIIAKYQVVAIRTIFDDKSLYGKRKALENLILSEEHVMMLVSSVTAIPTKTPTEEEQG